MKYFTALLLACLSPQVIARPSMDKEIEFLLSSIKESSCQFIRNGKSHSPDKAISHIKRKYEHYQDDIDSTEMFIELSATKSSMSGKPYYIACPNQEKALSKDWLLQQLESHRKTAEKKSSS